MPNPRVKKAKAAKTLTGPPKTGGYEAIRTYWGFEHRTLQPLTLRMIEWMLWEPTIQLGLAMRKAPLLTCEFGWQDGKTWREGVRSPDAAVSQFLYRQIQRLWQNDIDHLLTAQEYGWAAAEVTYYLNPRTKLIEIDRLLPRRAEDCRALVKESEVVGVQVRSVKGKGNVNLFFPQCIFHAFQPRPGEQYGDTVLRGAYQPWCDKNLDGGSADVRRLFLHKDAYGGMTITYPVGHTYVDGQEVPNRDIARQLVEQVKAGGVLTLPFEPDESGKNKWAVERANVPANPQHILQAPKDHDAEMLRGIYIPDDVLQADSTGAWAGKRVPMGAFYCGLDTWLTGLKSDIQTQVLEPLVLLNFGKDVPFELPTKPLADQAMEQQSNAGAGAPGEGQPGVEPGGEMGEQPRRMGLDSTVGDLVRAARRVMDRRSKPVRLAAAKAPKGGVTIGGTVYAGGQWIPSEVMENATEEEKSAVASGGQDDKQSAADAKKAKADAKFGTDENQVAGRSQSI